MTVVPSMRSALGLFRLHSQPRPLPDPTRVTRWIWCYATDSWFPGIWTSQLFWPVGWFLGRAHWNATDED